MKNILKIISGSHLYGTNTPTSDMDYMSIHIGDKYYYFGLDDKKDEIDLSIVDKNETGKNTEDAIDDKSYEIKKYVKLAIMSNPNILEMLYVNDKNLIHIDEYGKQLLDNKYLFISKKAYSSFIGYASSQKHKMFIKKENHKQLKEAYNFFTSINNNKTHLMQYVEDESLDMPFIIEHKNNYQIGDLSFQKHIFIKKVISILADRLSKLTNRDELILKYGYDTKFASHLIRLLDEGKQILEEGKLTFPIRMKDVVLDIKQGKYKIDEVIQLSDEMENELKIIKEKSELPEIPDYNKINHFLTELVFSYFIK